MVDQANHPGLQVTHHKIRTSHFLLTAKQLQYLYIFILLVSRIILLGANAMTSQNIQGAQQFNLYSAFWAMHSEARDHHHYRANQKQGSGPNPGLSWWHQSHLKSSPNDGEVQLWVHTQGMELRVTGPSCQTPRWALATEGDWTWEYTGPSPNSTDGEAEVKQEGLQFIALINHILKKKCLSSMFWFKTRTVELQAATDEQTFISGTFPSPSVTFITRHFHKAEKGQDIHTDCLRSSKAKVSILVCLTLNFIISQKWLKISLEAKCGKF